MTGRLMMVPSRTPIDKHEHVCVRLVRRSQELRFRDPRRFGGLWFANGDGMRSAIPLRPLGPDALSIRLPVLRAILQRRRQIKALLLDQQAIGGLGNIYCDETLFAARIHPLTQACELTEEQVRSLARSIRTTLRASIASGGTTFSDYRGADGAEGAFQKRLRVYGREGEECRRCRARIERITAAGRSTCLCPHCQRLS
jgi:formamidopyrimidine-DNA glycosylase